MEVLLIGQFGQVEHSISGTIFFGPVEVPLIESRLYFISDYIKTNIFQERYSKGIGVGNTEQQFRRIDYIYLFITLCISV